MQTSYTQPGFFGKDDFVPFIAQVEDVDDPKRSNRVRVRCNGWHPKGKGSEEGGVKTEDLPWAITGMPTTAAQQMRSGTKHGLLPGSWVWGYFLDGREAQKPIVVQSIDFSAFSTEGQNFRESIDIGSGTIPEDVEGFGLYDLGLKANSGIFSQLEEEGSGDDPDDASHHQTKDDSNDESANCRALPPSAFTDKKVLKKKIDIPYSQVWDTPIADALCGGVQSARGKIASLIESMFPSEFNRIVGTGDIVYDALSGNRINLNAIFRKIANQACAYMKDAIQVKKAVMQNKTNLPTFRATLSAGSSRSPLVGQEIDVSLSLRDDCFNALIDQSLDSLCDQILNAISSFNNQSESSKGDNRTSELKNSPNTKVQDSSAICLTDAVINKIELFVDEEMQKSQEQSAEEFQQSMDRVMTLRDKIMMTVPEDYECEDDYRDEIEEAYNKTKSSSSSDSQESGNSPLDFMTNMDFTQDSKVFNKCSVAKLDFSTRSGCNPSDIYNTATGLVGGLAGVSSGFGSGGGSGSGKSSKRDRDIYENIGFGGVPLDVKTTTDDPLCEESTTRKIDQGFRNRVLSNMYIWAPVDYYEPNRQYELHGEIIINGANTDRNRILVADQVDRTQNGLYVTSPGDWKRTTDADDSVEYKTSKIVRVKALRDEDAYFVYTSKDHPKIDMDAIEFTKVFYRRDGQVPQLTDESSKYLNRYEGEAINPFVQSVPGGDNAVAMPISLPSSDPNEAKNYQKGIPNGVLIKNPGSGYYFDNDMSVNNYPSIFIDGYAGTPIPVVDEKSGEIAAILVNPVLFSNNFDPSISIISDDSNVGISTKDERYDLIIVDFYVMNTGKNYFDPKIEIRDKDTEAKNGEARVITKLGRVVDVEVINTGTGFKRLPEVIIRDGGRGFGAEVYAILGLVQRNNRDSYKDRREKVNMVMCPSKNRVNLYGN